MMATRTLMMLSLVLCTASSVHAQSWRDVSICVIDDAGALVEVSARRNTENFDTTTADGRPFGSVYPVTADRYGAGNAWFAAGEPIAYEGRRYEKYGLPRVLGVDEVVRVGEWAGVPLFGDPLAGDVVYLPVRTGCEFQPYSPESGPVPTEPAPARELTVLDHVGVWIVPAEQIRIGDAPDSVVTIREIRFSPVATEVLLEFYVPGTSQYSGTLHPPGAPNAFILRDASGTIHQPFAQGGWASPDHPNGWGSMQVPAGRPWHVLLFFPPIPAGSRAWLDLREGSCTDGCWNFHDIQVSLP